MSGLRFHRKPLPVDEAQQAALRCVRPMETENVALEQSFGRRLAVPVTAGHPVPHFRRSGVDGYAIRAADSAQAAPDSPARLRVIETIPCGTMPGKRIEAGEAAKIMTGAAVPEGADAVIMLEMTEAQGESAVHIRKRMEPGENITAIGQEIAADEALLGCGRVIGPGEAALLAAFGYASVPVYRRPKVAVFSTGSELLEVHRPLEPGKIRNSNSYMLACQVQEAGGEAVIMPALPDDPAIVERELRRALEHADCIVTSGGVSVGDKDVLVDVFERWDGTLLFNKVAMRPGSPTSVGLWNDKLLFALSGNPGACFVAFELLVRPCLRAMLGHPSPLPPEMTACLGVDYSKGSAYSRYVRGVLEWTDGTAAVKPAGKDKSSVTVSIKDADCLIRIPAGGRGASAGDNVRVILL